MRPPSEGAPRALSEGAARPPGRARGGALSPGFTLIEMLAVMLAVSLLLTVALDFYVDLSRQTTRATELTRGMRRGAAILDRVASDLEHTLLVAKPAEADPLTHPWLFLAEPLYAENGSDRLKLVRRVTPRSLEGPASEVAVVAYLLRPSPEATEDGVYALYRWSWPELPPGLDRDFPLEDDPDALLLADDVSSFALRFLDPATGEWVTRWDSSLVGDTSRLPLAVEIEVGVVGDVPADPEAFLGDEPVRYVRRVQLPLRPLDLVALLDPGDDDADGADDAVDEDLTVGDCLGPEDVGDIAEVFGISIPEAEVYYARNVDLPWSEALAQAPGLDEIGFCP